MLIAHCTASNAKIKAMLISERLLVLSEKSVERVSGIAHTLRNAI